MSCATTLDDSKTLEKTLSHLFRLTASQTADNMLICQVLKVLVPIIILSISTTLALPALEKDEKKKAVS